LKIIKPPAIQSRPVSVFLAGSIEMGAASDWQVEVTNALAEEEGRLITSGRELVIFNPRRDNWDSSWEQTASNPHFAEQVNWELKYLEEADVKAFYFDPNTKSPVTLLELGLCLAKYPTQTVVCCPPGYWRRGNLEITCARHKVRLLDNMFSFISMIVYKIGVS
jgi:hypothetical protein